MSVRGLPYRLRTCTNGQVFTVFGRLVFFEPNEGDTEKVATESADFLPTPPTNRKSPAHAACTRPFAKKYRATAARAPLRDAISPKPPEALQYPAAAVPPNVHATITRSKTP